jgi:hypothetical protein
MGKALLLVGKFVAFVLGLLFFGFFSELVVSETRLFLDPRYEGFWKDVEEYHLKTDGRKTNQDLVRQYGIEPVMKYFVSPGLNAAYLPSEDAAQANIVGYLISDKERLASENSDHDAFLVETYGGSLFILLVSFAPMVFVVRQIQRWLTSCLCLGTKARQARAEYFAVVELKSRYRAIAGAFAFAVVMSVINAFNRLTPAMQFRGITAGQLAGVLLAVGYFSGLGLLLLSYLVDVGFLVAGSNPHLSIWDNVIAIAVMVPVLVLVYDNSWTTVVTGAVTGLAGSLYDKRSTYRVKMG